MELNNEDKKLIRQIATHFKFSLGDAYDVFKYAKYQSDTKNDWLKGMCTKAKSIEEVRALTSKCPKFNLEEDEE